MRKKPGGRKYRNLYARGELIWFEKLVNGRRTRRSCRTSDWEVAAAVRDEWERQTGASRLPVLAVPTFGELVDRYLEWMTHLAATTQDDRRAMLRVATPGREEGLLRAYFGHLPVDEIRKPLLLEWWHAEVEGKGRSQKTGRNYLDALSGVLALAVDSEVLEANPVDGFRAVLRRRNRTQQGRAQGDATASICPIEDPDEVDALVAQSRSVGGAAHIVDLDSGRHNAGLRTRLVSLIGKMRSVGDELYASRIKQAQAAIDILDQLISLDEASLDQYAKTITMIEIEQESLAVTESMTDEAAGMIAERVATLDEVLEQNADLRLQLEANAEVQRLLS